MDNELILSALILRFDKQYSNIVIHDDLFPICIVLYRSHERKGNILRDRKQRHYLQQSLFIKIILYRFCDMVRVDRDDLSTPAEQEVRVEPAVKLPGTREAQERQQPNLTTI